MLGVLTTNEVQIKGESIQCILYKIGDVLKLFTNLTFF